MIKGGSSPTQQTEHQPTSGNTADLPIAWPSCISIKAFQCVLYRNIVKYVSDGQCAFPKCVSVGHLILVVPGKLWLLL